jgi:glycosyltransferase involved in cell wall biosynthesis
MKKINIFRSIDKFGWAYYFTSKEQQKYSQHNITYNDWEGMITNFDKINCDVFYFPSPIMCDDNVNKLIKTMKNSSQFANTKIIGAYSGLVNRQYAYADLIMPISIIDYLKLKNESIYPVTFLPESVDTEVFKSNGNREIIIFTVGWAGKNQPDKRVHLLGNFILPVKIQCNHGKEFFKDGRSQQEMVDFYNSIHCLILTSSHECMPRCVLEAMACGLPVIATNVGSIPWLLHKDWIVPVLPEEETIKEINKRIKLLWNDTNIREEVGKRNRQWIKKFFSCSATQPLWDDMYSYLSKNNFGEIYKQSKNYIKNLDTAIQNENKVNYNFDVVKNKLNVLKVIDEFGWAYDFIYKEQNKYTKHNLERNIISEVKRLPIAWNYDIIYLSGANMAETRDITTHFKLQNVKIIGAYAGEVEYKYQEKDIDLIVSISYPFTEKLRLMYPYHTVVWLPEGVDSDYFIPKEFNETSFNIGWAGRPCAIKRPWLLDKLKYSILKQQNWKKETFVKDRTLNEMKEFYKKIDILVLTSKSECMPRVVLEAMSCGLPIVATNVGSLNIVLDSEWLINEKNEEDIVKSMNEKLDLLKNNPELRRKVGERNRKFIETYLSWKIIQPLWDEVFSLLMKDDFYHIKELSNQYIKRIIAKIELNLNNSKQLEQKYYKNEVLDLQDETPNPKESKIAPINPSKTGDFEPIPEQKTTEMDIEPYKEFIIELNKNNISYWFLNNTCLECVTKHVLSSSPLQIGIPDNKYRLVIENIVKKYNLSIEITVEKRRTKDYRIYCLPIKVPVPVIKYLEDKFNKKWEELNK